ncbi:phosphotransferase [Salinibacterium sp. ZJ450]|uniref:phosphotransferase n=1 Tax=Salinibacterium sp. ZJ450 TaxID=2708338 RepID=UPI001421BEBE|nr:phosphotransferase [Salinibacterium sp. ZJ450]
MDRPPPTVLDAFGASTSPVPFLSGHGRTWRSGALVLKPLDMSPEELEWQESVLIDLDGAADVRVAPPLRARDGRLIVDGWTAYPYLPGAPSSGLWPEIMAAGHSLHRHLQHHYRPSLLNRRDDSWARADRVAWDEDQLAESAALPHLAALLASRQPVALAAQLIHGDLTDNVLLAPNLPPAIIDFSPYWRPAAYASAVVVADAVVFRGADTALMTQTAAEEGSDFPQLLIRALIFRAVADHLLAPEKAPVWADMFAPAVQVATRLAGSA